MASTIDRPPVLYHYCSTESFCSIVLGRALHLSCTSLSNDSEEGKLLSRRVEEMARSEGLKKRSIQDVVHAFSMFEGALDAYSFCMSTFGDVLSQWRAYASDGTGLAIGFSADALLHAANAHRKKLTSTGIFEVQLAPILYEPTAQSAALAPFYRAAVEEVDGRPARTTHGAYFSDRGRLEQADRGRRNDVAGEALG